METTIVIIAGKNIANLDYEYDEKRETHRYCSFEGPFQHARDG